MTTHLTLDFVSDISCPWCAIGLSSLLAALDQMGPGMAASLRFQPFELNPDMPGGGQDLDEHLNQKYGSTPEQRADVRRLLSERGAAVDFSFGSAEGARIYNTFNAHRLLEWVGTEHPERQLALKLGLLRACHTEREAMDADDVLLNAVETAGLDRERAMDILASEAFAAEVREAESVYQQAGIRSVPALLVNGRYVISGAQSPETYLQALSQIAQESANTAD